MKITEEPKKPKYRRECYIFSTSFYPQCPSCNAELTRGQAICEMCGTRIDWEGEREC